ncbi:MAG: hypothetical protein ACLP3R_17870 [Candidatus Korobacteraceae bacterium]
MYSRPNFIMELVVGIGFRIAFACLVLILIPSALLGLGEKFATFPSSANELPSPNGRFLVRSIGYGAAPGNFSGKFHALVLETRETGKLRKLCDYLGKVMVSWAADDVLFVNDYYTARGSRVLVFVTDEAIPPLVIDRNRMVKLLDPITSRHLLSNDHVFIAASKLEGDTLALRLWGYGTQDAKGFVLSCDYSLERDTASCGESSGTPKSVF